MTMTATQLIAGVSRKLGALAALALGVAFALPVRLDARDVYRHFLDPAIPNHAAILDTLARLEKSPKDAGLHNDLACLIIRDGFWRDALRELKTAADLDKKDSRPLFNAGLVHGSKGEWGAARRSFAKATRRDPGNWSAWWMLGFSNEKLDNLGAAVEAYKTSVRFDTSLFEVATNPYAAETRLKSRVLLETYEKRVVRATLSTREQLADPGRIADFLQKGGPAQKTPAAGTAEAGATVESLPDEGGIAGPVVTRVAPSSSSSPSSSSPGTPSSRSQPPQRRFPNRPEMNPNPAVSPDSTHKQKDSIAPPAPPTPTPSSQEE
jgi:hypothetical protein